MHFESLSLSHFKNYSGEKFHFSPKYNAIVGWNGVGKTNLLDAIYYLCMTKSNFSRLDKFLIQSEFAFFRLDGSILKEGEVHRIVCKNPLGKKKIFEANAKAYKRLADHVGKFPVVFVVPADQNLITEGSKERRSLLDNTLSQFDRTYLSALLDYNALLNQRNIYLKNALKNRNFNASLAMVYAEQMEEKAMKIFECRERFIADFSERFSNMYKMISNDQEKASCEYKSQLHETGFMELTKRNLEKDSIIGRTSTGIHKDDLVFSMNKHPVKYFASQGQTKTFTLSIKLTQFEIIRHETRVKPILLLDDLFAKLDAKRVEQLIQLLETEEVGQVFISDTDEHRIVNILEKMNVDFKKYVIQNGAIKKKAYAEEE